MKTNEIAIRAGMISVALKDQANRCRLVTLSYIMGSTHMMMIYRNSIDQSTVPDKFVTNQFCA